ncbi:MAG: GNAT family N-acetyltransferase [Alphaproteobacteria bacterium]|nr:GNAT family N-acetyltransferase [Alphaproteobacteria bacterium]MBV9693617.1 GNAT family N-acetyltransferase [Alphaproteobacteria bacterium]
MATLPWRDVVWAHADRRVLVRESGRVLCHAGLFFRDGLVDGRKVRICGVGGVMTAADARRRGHASAAMKRAAQVMREEGVDFGLLFCEEHNVGFYGTLGWLAFPGKVRCTQPGGPMVFDIIPAMILPLEAAPRGGVIDLCGLPW